MKKIIYVFSFLLIVEICFITVQAKETSLYPEDSCKEIFDAVGTFLYLADKAWKEKNTEDGVKYSEVAENYATVYDVFCK